MKDKTRQGENENHSHLAPVAGVVKLVKSECKRREKAFNIKVLVGDALKGLRR